MSAKLFNRVFKPVLLLVGVGLAFDLVSTLAAEGVWFEEVGYLSVFRLQVQTRMVLGLIALLGTGGFFLGNIAIAQRLRLPTLADPKSKRIRLSWLLPIVLGLSLLLVLMLIHYGQVAVRFWHPNIVGSPSQLISQLQLQTFGQILFNLVSPLWQLRSLLGFAFDPGIDPALGGLYSLWQLGLVLVFEILLILYPELLLWAAGVFLSLGFGLILSGHWPTLLQYFFATPFAGTDPIFGQNIGFFVFALPLWEFLQFWWVGLFLATLIAVMLLYLLAGNSLSQGGFTGFSLAQQRHLDALGAALMLAIALSYWLSRYELLYSSQGVIHGAGYTNVVVELPLKTVLSFLSLAIAALLLWRVIRGPKAVTSRPLKLPRWRLKPRPTLLRLTLGIFLVLALTSNLVLPPLVQRLVVQPNELERERPYIQRSIAFTRQGFDLEAIVAQTFDPTGSLTTEQLQANELTIRNIRLWDTRPLLDSNRQLQQIRLYYKFPDADIDRYTLKSPDQADNQRSQSTSAPEPGGTDPEPEGTERRQVFIAARELDYSAVPQQAQTWINRHLIYTHGYGFTMSPVNTARPGGLPEYFVRGIGSGSDEGGLRTASERIQESIPIGRPRIYYGELTNNYVMTSTRVKELDYPSGDDNVYSTYGGRGGISLDAAWRRWLFAKHLKDWRMLLTQNFTSDTRLLFRRQVQQRVRAIAPFLRFDSDPYLVVADADPDNPADQSHLYWIIDAYTTSDRYPYSDPGETGFNYIRNPVKVVVDAYHGEANFYVIDPQDPIITTWQKVFPDLFQPFAAMPAALRSHIRYPLDLFRFQSQSLLTYHMTDPQVFYNREDQWRVPTEIYASKPQVVEPYYLIMKLPTAKAEEFILLHPFTPLRRNNLIAWLAARSDGDNYGKRLLYQFPKQELVYGPEQIEALINQDPVISQQISLWNRQGSRAIQGNLLIIPIAQSLLYVEPIYLEAEQTSVPILARVIVVYENRISMAETLEKALAGIFQSTPAAASQTNPVVRPIQNTVPPPALPGPE